MTLGRNSGLRSGVYARFFPSKNLVWAQVEWLAYPDIADLTISNIIAPMV